MKKFAVLLVILAFGLCMSGCGKKKEAAELQEPLSLEALTAANAPSPVALEVKPQVETAAQVAATQIAQPAVSTVTEKLAEAVPPSGPYKPTAIEIQTALKNAGFYAGNIDGKIGPMTMKAIEEFQKANGLTADGKVGPKTWAALGKYLSQAATPPAQ